MSLTELYNFCKENHKIAVIHRGKLVGFKVEDY